MRLKKKKKYVVVQELTLDSTYKSFMLFDVCMLCVCIVYKIYSKYIDIRLIKLVVGVESHKRDHSFKKMVQLAYVRLLESNK